MFELHYHQNGQAVVVPFDRFARIGSADGCEARLADAAVPPHCLTVINDGPKGLRAMVSAAGVTINQQPQNDGDNLYIQSGARINIGSITVMIVAAEVVPTPVAEQFLPQTPVTSAKLDTQSYQRTPQGTAEPDSNQIMQLAMIAVCAVALVGMLGWMWFGGKPAPTSAEPATPPTFALMIKEIRDLEEWTLIETSREDAISQLRDAYQLKSRNQTRQALKVVERFRQSLLQEIPTDEHGRVIRDDGSSTGSEEDQTTSPPSVSEMWFEDEFQQRLFIFLSETSSKLKS